MSHVFSTPKQACQPPMLKIIQNLLVECSFEFHLPILQIWAYIPQILWKLLILNQSCFRLESQRHGRFMGNGYWFSPINATLAIFWRGIDPYTLKSIPISYQLVIPYKCICRIVQRSLVSFREQELTFPVTRVGKSQQVKAEIRNKSSQPQTVSQSFFICTTLHLFVWVLLNKKSLFNFFFQSFKLFCAPHLILEYLYYSFLKLDLLALYFHTKSHAKCFGRHTCMIT